MGMRMGPSYACLFVGHIEEQMLTQYQGVRPLMYRRYIDDIFGAFTGTCDDVAKFTEFADAFHPALRFTSNVSQHSVTFLDMHVQICARKLDTTVHYKPTDSHSYLQYQSSHPHKCKNSIPYSQFLRLRRICSSDAEFSERGKEMLGFSISAVTLQLSLTLPSTLFLQSRVKRLLNPARPRNMIAFP